MEFSECVARRHSYRGSFKNQSVNVETLRYALNCAYQAPTACNLQSPHLIAVTEKETVQKLAQIYGFAWAQTAPAAVLLLADPTLCLPSKGGPRYKEDFGAAAEQLLLAFTDVGLASCWIQGQIEGEKAKAMAQLLGVPEELQILGYFPVGYPEEEPQGPRKKPFESRCFLNRFGQGFDPVQS